MSHLQDLIDNGRKLVAERAALIGDRDAQKARAEAAEARVADLQARIDADDKTAGDASGALAAEIATEAGAATVVVDPPAGTTPQADAATGVTVAVPRDGAAPTATTTAGVSTAPDPMAAAVAVAAPDPAA